MTEHELTEVDGGLRVVTEHMASVRSAALGFFVRVGSRAESDAEAGLSHFLEHLLFRGTKKYASAEIDHLFDAMGAELNAGTDKESTTVYARMLGDHLPEAFEVMADMVWRPAFRDVDPERAVVLEEIAMYEDDPQDSVFDVLGQAVFGDHPLGRAIIGHREVVRTAPVDQIKAFHSSHYAGASVVVAAAGAVDHNEVVQWAKETWAQTRANQPLPEAQRAPGQIAPAIRFVQKDTEQCHICLGAPGLARHDERRFALRILDSIFGGLSSSRLFQSIRERHGLAYSVYSFSGEFSDTGQVGLYLGTRPDNLTQAVSLLQSELEQFLEQPATAEELDRSRENVKARIVLALESTGARMSRLGGSVLFDLPLLDIDEIVDRLDAVTLADLHALASELWEPQRLSAAGIGPDQKTFHSAVEQLCPGAKLPA